MPDTVTAPASIDTLRRLAQDPALLPLIEPVLAGERLSFDDGLTLIESTDLLTVGRLADLARARRHGDEVFFNHNRHINHTNICRIKCRFCAFSRTQATHDGAYAFSHDEMVEQALEAARARRDRDPRGRRRAPRHHVRVVHRARAPACTRPCRTSTSRCGPRARSATSAGSAAGSQRHAGAAGPRRCRARLDARRRRGGLLPARARPGVPRQGHRRGVARGAPPRPRGRASRPTARCSTATSRRSRSGSTTSCACASCRTSRSRPARASRQTASCPTINRTGEVGAFQCFIPLAFHPENTVFARRGWAFTAGSDDLRMVAVSRLMLDNVPNVKAYWIMISPGARPGGAALRRERRRRHRDGRAHRPHGGRARRSRRRSRTSSCS